MRKNILVTGGAGYIGSHSVLALHEAGYKVIVLDNLIYGHREIIETIDGVELIIGDISDKKLLNTIFKSKKIDAVMHFSAFAYVGESVINPMKYYNNNLIGTLNLLNCMIDMNVKYFIFSSTCATYGIPNSLPINEDNIQNPINPYGRSKLMVEKILKDYDAAYGLTSIIFRYFNAAGADPKGRAGENHDPETHIIPLVLDVAAGNRDFISIFGTDYKTKDGSCVRDYIHVTDLANAHILGLEFLLKQQRSTCFNLGNENGISVKDIIKTAEKITGSNIAVKEESRRLGDPPILLGSSEKAKKILGWNPVYNDISTMIKHAWNWHKKII